MSCLLIGVELRIGALVGRLRLGLKRAYSTAYEPSLLEINETVALSRTCICSCGRMCEDEEALESADSRAYETCQKPKNHTTSFL